MRLLKLWPIVAHLFVMSCSLQHHTDRAERVWLNASLINTSLHDVKLSDKNASAVNANQNQSSSQQPFLTASAVNTYLRGEIQSPQIRELSGIAPVRGEQNKYWAINDSGNGSQLFALSNSGEHLGSTELPLRNRDWEDLASYSYRGEHWIALAETGDNLQRYPISSIYIFKQPDVGNMPSRVESFQRIDFTYEDGPQNVESVAVSVEEGQLYLIAKDTTEPAIYTLPLAAGHATKDTATRKLVAKRVGQLGELQPGQDDIWWERLLGAKVLYEATAADISADDRTAVVANYRHVYLFKRAIGESWASAFAQTPQIISSHRMEQSESVAFSADARQVIVSSEGVSAPVLAILPSGR